MQKWNLLKKTAPCILSLAVAATTFPTAVMASDLDAAVVSEAEAGDTEDFSTEETAEDTEAVAEEAIEDAADITEEAAEDVAVPEAAADETEDIQQEEARSRGTLFIITTLTSTRWPRTCSSRRLKSSPSAWRAMTRGRRHF